MAAVFASKEWMQYADTIPAKDTRKTDIVRFASHVMDALSDPNASPRDAWLHAVRRYKIPVPLSMRSALLVGWFHERGEEFKEWYREGYNPKMDFRMAERNAYNPVRNRDAIEMRRLQRKQYV